MWVAVKDRSEHSCIWRKFFFMMSLFSSQIGVLRAFPQAIRSTGYADTKVSLPDDNLDSADSIFFF